MSVLCYCNVSVCVSVHKLFVILPWQLSEYSAYDFANNAFKVNLMDKSPVLLVAS